MYIVFLYSQTDVAIEIKYSFNEHPDSFIEYKMPIACLSSTATIPK